VTVTSVSPVATNYAPLPVVIRHAEGVWVEDVEGVRYLDCLSAYSANNFGHRHPRLLDAARQQLDRHTLVSRAFDHDRLEPFCAALAGLVGKQVVLPMNTGAEAVESALKIARKWGNDVTGVPRDRATVVVADGNFHGRTTTIVGFSDDPGARDGFGPFAPGFRSVPFGDVEALAAALDATTVAVLLEPVQGEAGVVVPPAGYFAAVRALCDANGILLVADEVQSGLGRTGRTLALEHEGVRADLVVLGKSLGGGIVPVSAVVGDHQHMRVLTPGTHGSTFGGNGLACAVGEEVVRMLSDDDHWQTRADQLGAGLAMLLAPLVGAGLTAVRTRGLWAGLDVDPAAGTGREVAERLLRRGVLVKDCHGQTLRLAPPLVIRPEELAQVTAALAACL
jgi:ornithine aminotransferase